MKVNFVIQKKLELKFKKKKKKLELYIDELLAVNPNLLKRLSREDDYLLSEN